MITKQPGHRRAVTVGTVTAQLLYEIAEPAYANPDVVAHFDTDQRCARSTATACGSAASAGSPPPATLKVAINDVGGYRNTMTMVLTGLDVEAKAAHAETLLFDVLGGREQFDAVDVQLLRSDRPDAATNEQATAQLRVTVKDADPREGRARVLERGDGAGARGYAGFFTTTPPTSRERVRRLLAGLVPRDAVEHAVVLPDGTRVRDRADAERHRDAAVPPATTTA